MPWAASSRLAGGYTPFPISSRLTAAENVEIIYDSVVKEICGNVKVESVKLENKKTQEEREVTLDGVFIAVGMLPETKAYEGLVTLDEAGYILYECKTDADIQKFKKYYKKDEELCTFGDGATHARI